MRPLQLSAAATLAVASLLPIATGADAAVAAAGTATSTATLASVTAAGKKIAIGTITSTAGTTSGALAKITLAPLNLDGTDLVPAVTVEPSNSPVTVPGASTPAAIASALSVSSPSFTLNAAGGDAPASGLTTPDGLGSVSILGMPIGIDGTLSVGSLVNKSKADAAKTLTVTDVALPSIADILAALGIDISKLPVDVLNDLLTDLPLGLSDAVKTAVDAANGAIDTAQGTVDTELGELQTAQSALNTATADNAAKQAAKQAAQTAFNAAIAAIPMTAEAWALLTEAQQELASTQANALEADLVAKTALAAASAAALPALQTAVETAQGQFNAALAALLPLIDVLAGLVEDALGDTPLVSLASATVGTLARVDAGKTASVVGSVSGLKVLGGDVIDTLTGSSTLDIAGVAGGVIDQVNTTAQGVMNELSSTLAGATGMIVPAPQVKVLQKLTKTGTDGAFGTADATVAVLSITMQPITLPEDFALDSVLDAAPAELPENISSIADGVFEATGFDLSVGTLVESARFRPAALDGAPNAPAPNLPATGAPYGIGLLAALALGVGVLTRRSMLARAER